MAVFEVKTFEANAEVLGKVRSVAFNNQGDLVLTGLDVGEAKQILDLISTGLKAATLGDITTPGYVSDVPEAQAQTPPAQPVQQPAAEAKPARGKPKKAKPAAKAGNGAADPAPTAAEPAADNVVALNPEAAAEPPTGEDLVAQAAGKTKLKDVILVLRDGGFDDADKLVAECVRIKEQVPVLAKIANIEDRVKRVLERLSA